MESDQTDLLNRFCGEVRNIPENVQETRTIPFVISDDSKDRHNSRLNMDNWYLDPFMANGVVGYQHDVYGGDMCRKPDPDDVIGSAKPYFSEVDGKKVLMADVTFETKDINERADKIFKKVLAGTLKATSVGFIPITDDDGKIGRYGYIDENGEVRDKGTFYYYGQELVELSIVNIPSNRNSLQRNLRDYASNALRFLKRELGQDVTYGEIEEMRVLDVIKMLETGEKPKNKEGEFPVDAEKLFEAASKATPKKLQSEEAPTKEGGSRILRLKQKNEELTYDSY